MKTFLLSDSTRGRIYLQSQGIDFEKTKRVCGDNAQGHMELWSIISQEDMPCMIITDKVHIDSDLQRTLINLFIETNENGFLALYSETGTQKSKMFSIQHGIPKKVYYAITPIQLKAYIISPKVAKLLYENIDSINNNLLEIQVQLQLQKNLIRPLFVKPGIVKKAVFTNFKRRRKL